MKTFYTAIILIISILTTTNSLACEQFKTVITEELKEHRDILTDENSDPLDRLFAFREMSCSDNPSIRAYGIREGLNSAKDDLVRHEIIFEALIQLTRLDIKMSKTAEMSKKAKEFLTKNANLWYANVVYRDRAKGCISFYYKKDCDRNRSAFIRGGNLEINYDNTIGSFKLTSANELVGFLFIPNGIGKVPAVITLF